MLVRGLKFVRCCVLFCSRSTPSRFIPQRFYLIFLPLTSRLPKRKTPNLRDREHIASIVTFSLYSGWYILRIVKFTYTRFLCTPANIHM